MVTRLVSAAVVGWTVLVGSLAMAQGSASTDVAPPITSPGANVYIVATAARAPGSSGSNWVSDVVVHNPGTADAVVNLYLMKSGQDNTGATGREITAPAGQSVKLANVVGALFGEASASGAILLGSDVGLLVTSRTFNDAPTGTFGQYVEGYPALRAVGANEEVRLIQLTRTTDYRTNLGFANATGSSASITATLHDSNGTLIGVRSYTVPPYGYVQEYDVFAKVGVSSVNDAYAVISSATANVRYFTYASVIDNRTNDPVCIVPVGRRAPGSASGVAEPVRAAAPDTVGPAWLTSEAFPPGTLEAPGFLAATTAQVATVTHLAGTLGGSGHADGAGSEARFSGPGGVAVDAAGNIYVADTDNHTIRKVTPGGVVTTLAGLAETPGSSDGTGSAARFNNPHGIAADAAGNLYVADTSNSTIRKVTPDGTVTTVAGLAGSNGSSDGTGGAARFSNPEGIAVDAAGNLYVADTWNDTVRTITPSGVVATLAGLPNWPGISDGTGNAARFYEPAGIAVDSAGTVYVADTANNTIRKVTSAGVVTTLAGTARNAGSSDGTGTAAKFSSPHQIAVDAAGDLYVADTDNNEIRKVTSAAIVTTLAGSAANPGSADGTGSSARFYGPQGIAVDTSGTLHVADSSNDTVRTVTSSGGATTLAGLAASQGSADGSGSAASFAYPSGIAADTAGNLYVADTNNHTIRKVTPDGTVTTLAGTAGSKGSSDGTGTKAKFFSPQGVAVDSAGNVFVADTYNDTIRKITPSGVVTTVAGLATNEGSTDGTGNKARFCLPAGIAVDSTGNIYVADTANHTIRKVTSGGVVTTLAGLAGIRDSTDGTGNKARFYWPIGIAADAAGSLWVADTGNFTIRKVTPGGSVTTLAGLAGIRGSSDGTGPAARFSTPGGIAADGTGNLYVADTANHTIREVTPAGAVSTVAGLAGRPASTDGRGSAARFFNPFGITVDTAGNLYVADTFNNAIRMVTWSQCSYSLDATSASFAASGGAGSIGVGSLSGCNWTAASNATWITIVSGASGNGNGSVSYAVAANPGTSERTGTLTVADQTFTVTQNGVVCTQPSAPVLTAPATAASDASYILSWTVASTDGTYELQESTDASFAGASTASVTGTSQHASHTAVTATAWYSRVRAVLTCAGSTSRSEWSNVGQTVVGPPQPTGDIVYVPAAAHVTGNAGTNWRTDLEVHNPGATQARFTVELLKRDQDNSSPQAVTFTLDAGTCTRFADVLFSPGVGFGFTGAGTVRVTPYAGTVMVTSRTYNDQTAGTFGQFIPGQAQGDSVAYGQEARLIQLAQSNVPTTGYRTDLGLVNTGGQPTTVEMRLYRGDGAYLGTQTATLPPYGFTQVDKIYTHVTSEDVPDGFVALRTTTSGGSFLAYASVIDNRSGDPIYVPARVVQ